TGVALGVTAQRGPGRRDDDPHYLTESFTTVTLAQSKTEHGEVVAGVRPRVGLGQDVRTLEVRPPLAVHGRGAGGRHLGGVGGVDDRGHRGHSADSLDSVRASTTPDTSSSRHGGRTLAIGVPVMRWP